MVTKLDDTIRPLELARPRLNTYFLGLAIFVRARLFFSMVIDLKKHFCSKKVLCGKPIFITAVVGLLHLYRNLNLISAEK